MLETSYNLLTSHTSGDCNLCDERVEQVCTLDSGSSKSSDKPVLQKIKNNSGQFLLYY